MTDNPMNRARRCLARNRKGLPCMAPALRGKERCRLHGGHSTGAPSGNRNAWKTGARSAGTEEALRYLRAVERVVSPPKGKSRRKGVTMKTEELPQDPEFGELFERWQQEGMPAIARVRESRPADFVRLIARLVRDVD
jgi:hypothetical protein